MSEFLAVCGVDGVGKTSVATALALEMDYVYVKTPSPRYKTVRSLYEGPTAIPFSRFCFYLGALYESSLEIKDLLARGYSVIADRYLLSLQIYHEVLTGRPLSRIINEVDFVRPHLNLILLDSPNRVEERLNGRNSKGFDHLLENDFTFIGSVAKGFSEEWPESVHVDCEGKNILQVVSSCRDEIAAWRAKQSTAGIMNI